MAEITTRSCDRWGTLKAKPCEIDFKADGLKRLHVEVDLSERGADDMVRAIKRCMVPPKTRGEPNG